MQTDLKCLPANRVGSAPVTQLSIPSPEKEDQRAANTLGDKHYYHGKTIVSAVLSDDSRTDRSEHLDRLVVAVWHNRQPLIREIDDALAKVVNQFSIPPKQVVTFSCDTKWIARGVTEILSRVGNMVDKLPQFTASLHEALKLPSEFTLARRTVEALREKSVLNLNRIGPPAVAVFAASTWVGAAQIATEHPLTPAALLLVGTSWYTSLTASAMWAWELAREYRSQKKSAEEHQGLLIELLGKGLAKNQAFFDLILQQGLSFFRQSLKGPDGTIERYKRDREQLNKLFGFFPDNHDDKPLSPASEEALFERIRTAQGRPPVNFILFCAQIPWSPQATKEVAAQLRKISEATSLDVSAEVFLDLAMVRREISKGRSAQNVTPGEIEIFTNSGEKVSIARPEEHEFLEALDEAENGIASGNYCRSRPFR